MAKAKILEKDTRCDCCCEVMKAGEAFRWNERTITVNVAASGYKTGYKTIYRPAHVNHCLLEQEEARIKAEKLTTAQRGLDMVRELGHTEIEQKLVEYFKSQGIDVK